MAEVTGRSAFTDLGTLGVEEEFYIVDRFGRPTSGTDTLVYGSDPPAVLEGRLDHELFKCIIETQTPKLDSLSEAADAVPKVRDALIAHADAHGYQIAGAGLHPGARWRELEHAEKPRYRGQLDRIQYPQHRNTTAGLHVHVGVDDADKAVWIANELRWYLPIMLALSVNSPFWNGYETGLASARAKIFEALPNTGMPTQFADYAAFDSFEQRMLATDSVNDRGELWFDVRPHSALGTVEIRVPDGQRDVDTVLAFVEYAHSLVLEHSDRYEDGESGGDHRRELLDENKWRAMRYGHDAAFISEDSSEEVSLGEVVDRECDRLGIDGIRGVFEAESGAAEQRRIRTEDGAIPLYESLVLSTSR